MRKIFLLILVIFFSLSFSILEDKFNDKPIYEVKQSSFPNCTIYTDSTKINQIYKLKLEVTGNGLLLPENGTILSDYILLPIEKAKIERMSVQDYNDIITFINSIDLQNRKFKK